MATKNFRSTVLEPTSEFAYGDKLRFTALSSINQVFKRSFSEVTIGIDGAYDIDLQYGKYRIDYKPYEGIWALFANVEVGAETTATTLQDLAMTSSPVTDDTILALQAILAETKVNAENAEKSSSDSIAAAAEAAKDRDEIEDMMLRAMTTADVEAIRQSNKAIFAASGVVEWGSASETPVNTLKNGLNCSTTAYTLLHGGKYHVAGLLFDIPVNSSINFDAAADGKITYNKTTGVVTKHDTVQAAFAAANADADVEVVTDRVDVYALEVYLRDITEADPMIYPHGYIHAQDSDINGVTTSLDSIRPDSYYAHYIGQTDVIRGKSVKWFEATNDEKLAILSVADKHGYIHYDPKTGAWRQWCVRACNRVGDGNGDWWNTDVNGSQLLRFDNTKAVWLAQGKQNLIPGASSYSANSACYAALNFINHKSAPKSIGDWRLSLASVSGDINNLYTTATEGNAYLLVLGTVARLSNSVWHPSHNPMGCYKYTAANLNPLGQGITSTEECFLPENIGTQSARPDSRVHNLIYGSGYGGVCRDMRYSAYPVTQEESDLQKFNTCNGTYRGFEKRVRTKVIKTSPVDGEPLKIWHAQHGILYIGSDNFISATQENMEHLNLSGSFPRWYEIGVYNVTRNILVKAKKQLFLFNTYIFIGDFSWEILGFSNGDIIELTVTRELSQSIGGEFYHCDLLLGENIDVTTHADFKNGWEGKLIDEKTDGSAKVFSFNRLNLDSSFRSTQSLSNGSWGNYSESSSNLQQNGLVDNIASNSSDVSLWGYRVNAHNTTKSVLNPINHVDDTVFISNDFNRAGFSSIASSLLNIHLKSDGGVHTQQPKLLNTLIDPNTYKLGANVNVVPISHSPLELSVPAHESSAIKFLTYSSESNSQITLNFAATELQWGEKNGVQSYGDDSQIHIVANESTMVDMNDNVVKVVTHALCEPLGWIK